MEIGLIHSLPPFHYIQGGALSAASVVLSVAYSRFLSNKAIAPILAHGGLSYESRGGAISFRDSTSTITRSHFTDNQIFGARKKGEAVWGITSGHGKNSIVLSWCSFEDILGVEEELKVRKGGVRRIYKTYLLK